MTLLHHTEQCGSLKALHERIRTLRKQHDTSTQHLGFAYTAYSDGSYTLRWGIISKLIIK